MLRKFETHGVFIQSVFRETAPLKEWNACVYTRARWAIVDDPVRCIELHFVHVCVYAMQKTQKQCWVCSDFILVSKLPARTMLWFW
jgi:hypothetical protein